MAEKATVELIEIFISFVEVDTLDENGKRVFSLPDDEINENNWRTELKMPVNKYDWLSFEKIFQTVFIYPEIERIRLCKLSIHIRYF